MLLPFILWIVLISIVLPFIVLFLLPLAVWRLFVNGIVFLWRADLVSSLTSRDLAFTSDDYYGISRKSVVNTSIVEGSITIETLREGYQKRILDNPYFYRMNCRPVTFMGYWFWQRTNVELESHIVELKETYSDLDLRSLLVSWVGKGFAPGSPLWKVKLVPLIGNKTAVVTKLHHMVGDGVAFMKLLEKLCDGGWSNLQTADVKPFSWPHWLYAWYNFPWKALKAYRLARCRKGFRPQGTTGEGFTSWTILPLEKIRLIRRAEKCLFPSVFAGAISQACYRLLQNSGKTEIPNFIRMVIPTPWPNRPAGTIGNHVAWLHAEVPLGDTMVIDKFEASVKYSYTSGLHGIIWQVMQCLYLLPKSCLAVYTGWGERNIPPAILSSIPGSLTAVKLMGNTVLQSFPVLALGCSTGVNACITTYADGAYVSIRVSKEVFPSQELLDQLLNKYLHEEIEFFYRKAISKEKEESRSCVQIAMP